MFEGLAEDTDKEYPMIDSTIVIVHQHIAGAKKDGEDREIGGSKGELSTKIHAAVDALGNLTRFKFIPGQTKDLYGANEISKLIFH